MSEDISYAGLDVHKKSINVALLKPDESKPMQWQQVNNKASIKRLVRKLKREGGESVRCCYEAGPCGFGLQRTLRAAGIECEVIAPTLIPRKPGERIKTDRRDACKLAELFRADLLTEVRAPTPEEESVRDICRCRDDIRGELMSARHRLGKFLLRRDVRYGEGKAWTQKHRRWLKSLQFEHRAAEATFDSYLHAIEVVEERMKTVEQQITDISAEEPYREPVAWLRCFRGIDTVTAMTIVAELHNFRRFETPRALMGYLGLVPSEHSSGPKTARGSITKAGNKHVRRILIEASWHYRHKPAVGVKLRKRREGQPGAVIGIADRAQQRLHKRYWRLVLHNNKVPNKAIVAVARELVGFIWAALYDGDWSASGGCPTSPAS
jgi:transposase